MGSWGSEGAPCWGRGSGYRPCRCGMRPNLRAALCHFLGERIEVFTGVSGDVLTPDDRVGVLAACDGDLVKLVPDGGGGRIRRRLYFSIDQIVGFEPAPVVCAPPRRMEEFQ